MNTILITGTAKCKDAKVRYDVFIWAASEGEQIKFITALNDNLQGYSELWAIAKKKASEYLKNDLLTDGAYTQYLDHLHIL